MKKSRFKTLTKGVTPDLATDPKDNPIAIKGKSRKKLANKASKVKKK